MTDLYHRVLNTHQWIYERTSGLLGHRLLLGTPTLLLHTIGRKSGRPRTAALIYARDDRAYLVVASAGGSPTPPDWLANLKAEPDCEIRIGTRKKRVHARVTLPSDPDFARRWSLLDAANRGRYTGYQKKTQRTIPIVELQPA
ncbi:nitroreductase/quinone reductase family protein [Nocardia sp. BMG51109]|uniref:nitroreductase/quinone reductase family protein n=1 Tax=Nocardia sp. BMG51109 TaxID=1056816 RepID=UPI00046357D8|nr:nitroreductase/quinone reductase family protein [Nocardia sp. BMG51109]